MCAVKHVNTLKLKILRNNITKIGIFYEARQQRRLRSGWLIYFLYTKIN